MAISQGVLHHDVLLSGYVQHWRPSKDVPWYMHDKMFPVVPVDKASNAYKVINQSTFMKTAKTAVGPRGPVSAVQVAYDPEGNYKVTHHALDGVIDNLEAAMADDVALYESLSADLPMVILKNTLEIDAYLAILNTANLGTNYENVAGADMFDSYGSMTGNPMLYIRAKCEQTMNITGRKVNFLHFDRLVWRALMFNPSVLSFLAVHAVGDPLQLLTIELFEKKLEDVLEKGALHVGHFRYDPLNQVQSQSALLPKSAIGPHMILGRFDPMSREDVSATKQFAFTGDVDKVSGSKLAGPGGDALAPSVATAPISAFTYPIYDRGQKGGMGVRVLTSRAFNVVRPSSLFVSLGIVDKTNAGLYGTQLT